ncbi:MAG TPA: ARMT1-like domain-containing protein [Patescibacteria group bacterium]|nr:ARMT1-like domain-containing protein [Patescibacteria group bacterium]
MKVGSRCGYCLLYRGYNIILRSTSDEDKRMAAVTEFLRMLGEQFNPDAVPSYIGTERDRVIKRVTGCPDAYADIKPAANKRALELLPKMEGIVNASGSGDRLRVACKVACIGNVIEYDVPGHSSDIGEALEGLKNDFYIDDIDKLEEDLGEGSEVLLLTDNAGEIAFDRLIVRELRRMGCRVKVAVKGGPVLNDALMEDAVMVGMTEEADEMITTGTDAIGVRLEESSEEFRDAFYGADAVIAKGMANWETLTEVPAPSPLLYLFRTKCEPVARSVGAPLHVCVAKLAPKGWRLA